MKRKLLILWIAAGLGLSACQAAPSASVTQSGQTAMTAGSNGQTAPSAAGSKAVTTAPPPKKTKPAATAPPVTYPKSGILSDKAEYNPGNPKTHALVPLALDTAALPDNTRPENESYRPVFEEYLKINYPEQPFRVVNIEDYQHQGVTYKKADAYSSGSADLNLRLFYDGIKLFDSFQKDVVSRQNTMNRWRFEFRKILAPLSRPIADRETVNLDVSYDYYKENIELIRLDQALEPLSTAYRRCLELYFNTGYTDPVKVSDTALKIYQTIAAQGYSFQEYFIHLEAAGGVKTTYRIPPELVTSAAFPLEMQKAMSAPQPDQLIQRVQKGQP